ncbi:MAG: metallophosphoesterase, partial [Synergistaceae bacterium]|nr:metallophosphoesterase [Synergistaceae bacterium]
MYELLSIGALLFVCRKLREAGSSSFRLKVFMAVNVLWLIFGAVAGFDFNRAEYDIFPLHFTEVVRAVNMNWIIFTLYLFMAFFAVSLLTRFKPFTKKKAVIAVLLALIVTGYSMYEAYNIQPRYVKISTKKLPEGTDRVRVVFLVDVHIGGVSTFEHLERVLKIADDAEPDILLLGGDIFDGDMAFRKTELERLKASAEKARYGAFAVNGNHEHYLLLDVDVETIVRECGYDLLIDERREVSGITLLGLEDIPYGWLRPFLKPEDKDRFVLVLKHRPGVPLDAEGRFDLQLSGHTHGGQFWPLGYFKNMALNSVQGLSQKAGGYVYVSNG